MNNLTPYSIKLDSHLHFYDCWKISLDQLLTVAHKNLSLNIINNTSRPVLPAICLLDTGKEAAPITRRLDRLNDLAERGWQKEDIELEPYSFWVRKKNKTMLVITGTQINTDEGLEVLVIGNKGDVSHGMPIKMILEQQRDGLLNIVPWAAGKWLSKRGNILTRLLETMDAQQFILGDNAGRPRFWKNIEQLEHARANNVPILCGSDPLPLPKHYLKSGTYGNLIKTDLDMEKPWTSIIQAIHKQQRLKDFGHLSSTFDFVLNQLKLRL